MGKAVGAVTGGLVGGIGGSLLGGGGIGGALNSVLGGPQGGEGQQALNLAVNLFSQLEIPKEEALKIILEKPELVAEMIPELEGQIPLLQKSALADLEVSQQLETMKENALGDIEQRMDTGLTEADRQALDQAFRASRAQAQAQDKAILQNMAERGVLGSGQEILMRQAAAQQALQSGAEQAQDVAMQSQANRDAAIQMLNQMRQQEFQEKSQAAQAQDMFDKYNLELQQSARQRDIERQNQAQQFNISSKQAIENQGTDIANQQEIANKSIPERLFNMELQKKAGMTGALSNLSGAQQGEANRKQQAVGQILGGGASVAGAALSDKRTKENIDYADNEIDQILNDLSPYKFDYKKGEQNQIGIMAQDLEKNPLSSSVVEEDESGVKYVNAGKAANLALASAAHINDRLKKLEKLLGEK